MSISVDPLLDRVIFVGFILKPDSLIRFIHCGMVLTMACVEKVNREKYCSIPLKIRIKGYQIKSVQDTRKILLFQTTHNALMEWRAAKNVFNKSPWRQRGQKEINVNFKIKQINK